MGPTAQPIYALTAVAALGAALNQLAPETCDIGAGAAAVMASIDAV
jgi:pyridoxamine--pyruvate transaminase